MKKLPLLFKLLIAAAIILLLPSCDPTSIVTGSAQAAYEHHSIQSSLHDKYLYVRVDRAVHWYTDAYKTSRVNVSVFNDVVVLTGQVQNQQLRADLVNVVKTVPDIAKVYNLTTIGPPSSTVSHFKDAWISSKINAKLIAASEIDPSQIKVITDNGRVFLVGTVFPDQADIATDLAKATSGVQSVVKVFYYLHVTKAEKFPKVTAG